MKRLRLKCPFCGYGKLIVPIAVVLGGLAGVAIDDYEITGIKTLDIVLRFSAIAVIILIISHLWLYRTKRKEQGLIESAEKIQWRELKAWENKEAIARAKPDYNGIKIGAMFSSALIIAYLAAVDFKPDYRTLLLIFSFIVMIILWIFYGFLRVKKWQKIDNTARCAVFPIHHTYAVKLRGKWGWHYRHYHVIYTSEGKFVFSQMYFNGRNYEPEYHKNAKPISKVHIIKYKGMYTYVEYPSSSHE